MTVRSYVMESDEETLRLELKTDPAVIREQAAWAGLRPGMHVADIGCGPGKTTALLAEMAGPDGAAVGVDLSEGRIDYARAHYRQEGVEFVLADIREPLDRLGLFDFVWVRFVLEFFRRDSLDIVRNISSMVKPGGILCLVDLDNNCLSHYDIPPELEKALLGVMGRLERQGNFDPYAGRKLYSYLYDIGCRDIDVHFTTHHLIFGELSGADEYNWMKKIEIAAKNSGYPFEEFVDGFEGFQREFTRFFRDPRRFTYTPVMIARGRKA